MRHKKTIPLMFIMAAGLFGFAVFEVKSQVIDANHLNTMGKQGYLEFQAAPLHRAFAIAPGGAWAWASGSTTVEVAESDALNACRQYTEQPCHLYAVDDQIVFDEAAWNTSWDLRTDAKNTVIGTGRGNQFPDLTLNAPDGRKVNLSDLRGKPVFLHFWGSWCPPCQAEFPELQALYDSLGGDNAVTFVLVQGRESIVKSRRWAAKRAITMPLYDSGHQGQEDHSFSLADSSKVADRRMATAYPTTYVLDANGLVVFHQAGPGEQWFQYEKMFRHLAQ